MCGNHGKSLCSITDDSAAVSIKTIRQLYLATAEFIGERGFPKYLGFISLNYLSLYWQIPGTVNTEKTFMAKKLLKCHIKFTMRSFIYF